MEVQYARDLGQIGSVRSVLALEDGRDKMRHGDVAVAEAGLQEVECDVAKEVVASAHRHLHELMRHPENGMGTVVGDLGAEVLPVDGVRSETRMRQLHRAKSVRPAAHEGHDTVDHPYA